MVFPIIMWLSNSLPKYLVEVKTLLFLVSDLIKDGTDQGNNIESNSSFEAAFKADISL